LEHRLIGFVPITESFSLGEYMPLAHREVDAALEAGRRPIVVGGTGLYLRAALTELNLRPPPDPAVRARIQTRMETEGPEAMLAELRERAPEAAAVVLEGDRNRIIRYLELLEMGEDPDPVAAESQLWTTRTRVPTTLVGLVMDRDALTARIDARMEAIAAAAEGEVRAADAAGASDTARKAFGFEELLAGDLESLKRRTRRFARRQMTWLRKLPDVHVVDVTGRDAGDVAREVAKLLPG
jgi:tRNA dimethylallyltransferase